VLLQPYYNVVKLVVILPSKKKKRGIRFFFSSGQEKTEASIALWSAGSRSALEQNHG
jgi:hypothetical protein